nr:MAG TPA: hypothetical protein [Caudoviricetes sp.]
MLEHQKMRKKFTLLSVKRIFEFIFYSISKNKILCLNNIKIRLYI